MTATQSQSFTKKKRNSNPATSTCNHYNVVIIGAGMAGLTAAQELLSSSKNIDKNTNNDVNNNDGNDITMNITVLESNNYVGGRINGDESFIQGHVIDTGAEIIHGQNTLFTKLVDKYYGDGDHDGDEMTFPLKEEHFLLSHADGGPDNKPTKDGGKYGMYYMNNELMMYNDERISPLNDILGKLHEHKHDTSNNVNNGNGVNDNDNNNYIDNNVTTPTNGNYDLSVGEILDRYQLSPSLRSLAVASYGNTIGSCDLNKISVSMLLNFEEYWQNNEEEGDYQLSSKIGMYGIVKELYRHLLSCNHDHNMENGYNSFTMKLHSKVIQIVENDSLQEGESSFNEILIYTDEEGTEDPCLYKADFVIVTTPPPLWSTFMDLTPAKNDAVNELGMNKAIKCAIKLKERFWPENLQSIIMADSSIPEMWFSEFEDCVVATGFLTSEAAEHFDNLTMSCDTTKVTEIFVNQMSQVFSISKDEIEMTHLETRVYVWDHAYIFPKVGFSVTHHHELARPIQNIHFAGEATNTNAGCTVQAAMETGVREGHLIIEKIRSRYK